MTEHLPFTALSESRWANGQGRKADIAGGDGWSLGFAWLDGTAPFSDYTGINRTITLVEGDGFVLDFVGQPPLSVTRIGVPADFDGGWRTQCRLLGGPCCVLNAASARGRWRHAVRIVAPHGAGRLQAGNFVVVLRGQALVGADAVGPRDSLRVTAPAAISGSADALVALVHFELDTQ